MLDCLERFTYRDFVMRKLLQLVMLSLTGSVLFLQSLPAANSQRAAELLEQFSAMHPRTEASGGELDATATIITELESLGIEPQQESFEDFQDGHSFSSVVRARIEGESNEDLLILVPIDHERNRASEQDGSASLALALALVEQYHNSTPPLNIEFVFLGAEQGPFGRHPMGTRLLLRDFFPERPSFALYLDLRSTGGGLAIEHGSDGNVAPSWLVEAALTSAHATALPVTFPGTLGHLHRAGVTTTNTPVGRYLEAELPALGLYADGSAAPSTAAQTFERAPAGRDQPEFEQEAWLSELIEVVDGIIERSAGGVDAQWDRHYVVFELPGGHVVIPETVHVIVVWVIAAAMLLYGMTYRARLTRYLRSLRRNLWSLPILFLLVFGFLALSTVLLERVLELRGFPTLWQFYPLPFFVMKLTLAIFLFATVFQVAFRLPFSKHGSFYSAAAILVLMVLVIVMAGVSISFSYYFLWALICAFLFSITRKKVFMPLWLLLAPLWFLVAATVVFARPELGAVRALLLSPVRGNAILALVILPFILMLVRIDFLLSPPSPGKALFSLKLLSAVTGVASVAFIAFVVVITPFEEGRPQPVEIQERISFADQTRSVRVESQAPLPSLRLSLGDELHTIEGGSRRAEIQTARLPQPVEGELTKQTFLDRIQHRLVLEPEQAFDDLTIRLEAPESFLLFDANFPFSVSDDGTSADIYVGTRPPVPLEVEYTVPAGVQIETSIEALWFDLSQPYRLGNGAVAVRASSRVTQPFVPAE